MRAFVWLLGRDGELLDSHLFFFDRYSALADRYRAGGRVVKAEKCAAIANAHYLVAPDDDPPPKVAAIAMPVPRPVTNTNAVSTTSVKPAGRERRRSSRNAETIH